MAPELGGNPQEEKQPHPAFELRVWPVENETEKTIVFEREPDGRITASLTGRIQVTADPEIIFAALQSLNSPVRAGETQSGPLIPERTAPPATEPHSTAEKRSWVKPLEEVGGVPEDENELFNLKGNPAKKLRYRVTKKSNTRIQDFVFATHPDPNNREVTEHWRVLAFGDEAEKVRDQVEVGQKDVEMSARGPKYWTTRKKVNGEWKDYVVKGYYAGFVKVPRKYRKEQQSGKSPDQQ